VPERDCGLEYHLVRRNPMSAFAAVDGSSARHASVMDVGAGKA